MNRLENFQSLAIASSSSSIGSQDQIPNWIGTGYQFHYHIIFTINI